MKKKTKQARIESSQFEEPMEKEVQEETSESTTVSEENN